MISNSNDYREEVLKDQASGTHGDGKSTEQLAKIIVKVEVKHNKILQPSDLDES